VGKWCASVASGEPFEAESRVRRADGEYQWFLLRKVPFRDESGKIVKWFGSGTGIEDRKEAEDCIRLIIDTIPTMAWSVRPDGAVDFVYQRSLENMGLFFKKQKEKQTSEDHHGDLTRIMVKWLAELP